MLRRSLIKVKGEIMKLLIRALLSAAILILLVSRYAYSASTDNHTVTVTVTTSAINELAITDGNAVPHMDQVTTAEGTSSDVHTITFTLTAA